ncbi:MAG: division/cell wall cluster transcriptional repressor MraZ [Paracoccaceae bacterium]|nr:division/cell wall cluster transcriptional repressor MraZ [Paracoccaceae bacterium]
MRRFRGESLHKVDVKGRVSIPAQFRRVLEEGDPDFKSGLNPSCVLVHNQKSKKCLEGYSISSINEVDDLVSRLPRYSRDREILERMLNAQSSYAQIDDNGRLVLSLKLRQRIEIESEAIFIGMGDKFQVWEPNAYRRDMEQIEYEFNLYDEKDNPFNLLQSKHSLDA